MIPPLSRGAATQLIIIRTAMLLGLLIFGAVTWYTQRQHRVIMLSEERMHVLSNVFVGVCAFALIALIVLRNRASSVADDARRVSMYIIGYAIAECAGLFGGVVWYLGASRDSYIAGLVLLVVAFQILPVPRPR